MKRVAVIGGGFAGLAAGVALAERGVCVTVLEGRPRLGGRAYSFRDEASGMLVDNGQHAMMGCYTETLRFLDRISPGHARVRRTRLRVDLIDPRRGGGTIAGVALPGPLHMLGAVLRYRLLSRRERLGALAGGAMLRAMRRRRDSRLGSWTVTELLGHLGQSANACASFWNPVAIATLNESPTRAAAAPYVEVLTRAFFGGRRDSDFILPAVGLSDLYTDEACSFVERRGGRVERHAHVARLRLDAERVVGVELLDGRAVAVDACIATVPPRALAALLPPAACPPGLGAFESSPIVSTHLWYDHPVLDRPFVGLIGTTTHWLFNRSRLVGGPANGGGQCVSAVISGDRAVATWDARRITAAVDGDVRAALRPAAGVRLLHAVVVKEKEATTAPTPAAERRRPGPETRIHNLMLGGDWTATGLPPTIESAVLSGHRAANLVAARL